MHEPALLQIPLDDQPFVSQNVYVSRRMVTPHVMKTYPPRRIFVMGNDTSSGNAWQGVDEPSGWSWSCDGPGGRVRLNTIDRDVLGGAALRTRAGET